MRNGFTTKNSPIIPHKPRDYGGFSVVKGFPFGKTTKKRSALLYINIYQVLLKPIDRNTRYGVYCILLDIISC